MQTLDSYVAAAQIADRHAAARTSRAARRARNRARRPQRRPPRPPPRRGGGRAGARPPRAPRQRAAPDAATCWSPRSTEQIVAAVPLDGGRAIADPFRPTADIVELLARPRGAAGRARPRAPRSPRVRMPRVRVA